MELTWEARDGRQRDYNTAEMLTAELASIRDDLEHRWLAGAGAPPESLVRRLAHLVRELQQLQLNIASPSRDEYETANPS